MESIEKNVEIDFSNPELFRLVGEDTNISEQIYTKPYSYWKTVWKKSFSSPTFIICSIMLFIFLIMSFTIAIGQPAVPPGTFPGTPQAPSSEHWLGTGKFGEDIWTKVWIGSRTTIKFALCIFGVEVVLGLIIGAIWGYYRKLDLAFLELTRFITLVPSLVLWLVIIFTFDSRSIGVIIFAVSITNWIGLASLIRTQILITKNTEYNIASKILGSRGPKIIKKNIMPKILPIVIQTCAFAIPGAIAIDSSLAYLGFGFISGERNDKASLGSILNEMLSDTSWQIYPHLLIVPMVFVSALSLLFYLMGKVLADSLDPKTHR